MTQGLDLAGWQRWLSHVVSDPRDVASGLENAAARGCGPATLLDARVRSGPRLDAAGRLEVYRHAYHARLVDCLVDDYPALQHALGKANFATLCRQYIVRHPSCSPSLNVFGAHMVQFVREAPLTAAEPFYTELAELEWAVVEVIHACDGEPIALTALAALSAEAWAKLSLVPSAALRMCRATHPVNAYYQAFREGHTATIPEPAETCTLVRRRGAQTWRESLAAPAAGLLDALRAGVPVASALAAAAEGGVTTEQVGGWFQHWIGAGLFVGLAPSVRSSAGA